MKQPRRRDVQLSIINRILNLYAMMEPELRESAMVLVDARVRLLPDKAVSEPAEPEEEPPLIRLADNLSKAGKAR